MSLKSPRIRDILVLIAITLAVAPMVLSEPISPDLITVGKSSRLGSVGSTSIYALAGNVTELSISAGSVTKFWQGYFGSVSGTIVLADSLGNNLYEWGNPTPTGEIYATRFTVINWSNLECMNSSVVREEDTFLTADPVNSLDSVNQTFNQTNFTDFYTGTLNFTNGSCLASSINSTGNGTIFYEVLLMDANGTQNVPIYVSLIEQDQAGFNQSLYDFQMIVPENGNVSGEQGVGGNTTTYYFYVELN
ncbi:hypothetical protein J4475_03885 [Candidatus Woesearchaeota archaeon]|nr:hypothetical protein [Candidatus Woesearchaeota archaeon]